MSYICLLSICISCFGEMPTDVLCPFLNLVFCQIMGYLLILDISSLSGLQIFYPIV